MEVPDMEAFFVNQNVASKNKPTNSSFGHSGTKMTYTKK
jgi:hypothetical protein